MHRIPYMHQRFFKILLSIAVYQTRNFIDIRAYSEQKLIMSPISVESQRDFNRRQFFQ